jgi:prepilin-type N-terminal cleavage/methylation domain-containing protein
MPLNSRLAYPISPKDSRVFSTWRSLGSRSAAFSLIELVIVIAILAILSAIALPVFNGIRREAKISQVKNIMASVVKECKVAQLRGKSTVLADIPSARASVEGFQITSTGLTGAAFLNSNCFKQNVVLPGPGSSSPPVSAIVIGFRPVDATGNQDLSLSPIFFIVYSEISGVTTKACFVDLTTRHPEGCSGYQHYEATMGANGPNPLPLDHGWGVW